MKAERIVGLIGGFNQAYSNMLDSFTEENLSRLSEGELWYLWDKLVCANNDLICAKTLFAGAYSSVAGNRGRKP